MAKHNEIGVIGEAIAKNWLKGRDFSVIEQNYRKRWGEIDIVARGTDEKVHFVEVKSVSYETKEDLQRAVSHGTWRPEENVHTQKQKRLLRTIQTWLVDKKYLGKWQTDIITIKIVPREKYCRIKFMENVIFE
jgi:putative endonuclease